MSPNEAQAFLEALDSVANAPPPPAPPAAPGVMRTIADMGIKGAQGVVDLGQSVVGAASLATGGLAGKGMRAIGYDPDATNKMMGEYLSPAQQEAEQKVQGAEGFVDTLKAAADNPRSIAGSVVESLPGMLGIGGVTKMVAQRIALRAAAPFGGITTEAGRAAAEAALEKAASQLMWTSGAAEGAQSAGQIADQAQAAGRDYKDYAAPAIASGLATGAITRGAGALMGDPTTALFAGSTKAGNLTGSLPARVAKSFISEGAMQEMPQSAEEQVMTNVAMGKDNPTEGVGNQAAMGLVTGGVMGMGEGAVAHHPPTQKQQADAVRAAGTVPEVGPLSAAANVATELKAQNIENAPPVAPVQPEPAPVDAIAERIKRMTGQDREDAMHAYGIVQRDDVPKGVRQYNSKLLDQLLAKIDDVDQQKITPRLTYDTTPTGTMIAGEGGTVRPETHADEVNRAQAQAAIDAENERRVSLGMPSLDRVAPVTTLETGTPAPREAAVETAPAPATLMGKPAAPAAAPDTSRMGAFANAEDAQAYIRQQRRSGGSVQGALPLPLEDGSFGVATKDHPQYEQAQAFQRQQDQRAAGVQDGDVLAKNGEPFKAKLPATNAAKKLGDTHEAVPVKNGFVVRQKEWQAFPPDTGTLGVPRADMPQVKTEHHGALVNFLNARGVEHTIEDVDPGTLKPTQAEYSPQRVEKVGQAVAESDRSILVSSDGHVLDGHHQWLAAGAEGKPVKVIQLSKPAAEVLPLMKEFPSAHTAEGATHAEKAQGTLTQAAEAENGVAADEGTARRGEAAGPDARADRARDDGSAGAAAVTESKGEPHAADEQHEQSRVQPERENRGASGQAAEAVGSDRVQRAAPGEEADRGAAGHEGDQGRVAASKPKRESKRGRQARAAGKAPGDAAFSRTSPEMRALRALSSADALFSLPKSTKDTVAGIAEDNDPGIKVRKLPTVMGREAYELTLPSGESGTITIRPRSQNGMPHVYDMKLEEGDAKSISTERPGKNGESVDKDDVWLDASNLKEGGFGSMLYNIAATFAHNTGRIFIGDPHGLSDAALRRRTENMLSSALKFGTTEHLAPHARQVEGAKDVGVPPLRWTYGDDARNIESLVRTSLESFDNAGGNPITFDPATGRFIDSSGAALDREAIKALVGEGLGRHANAGVDTLRRNAVLRALSGSMEGAAARSGGERGSADARATERAAAAGPDAQAGAGRTTAEARPGSDAVPRGEGGAGEQRMGLLERLLGLASEPAAAGIFYRRGQLPLSFDRLSEDEARAGQQALKAFGLNVQIAPTESDLPQWAKDDLRSRGASGVRGLYSRQRDTTWLVRENIESPREMLFVALHEAFHRGLYKTFGADVQPLLNTIFTGNQNVRQETARYMRELNIGRNEAIEEVLADRRRRYHARRRRGIQPQYRVAPARARHLQ
jgi:hypothetical protein